MNTPQRDAQVVVSADANILTPAQVNAWFDGLSGWQLQGTKIVKRFEYKGFAKAVEMANLAAWHSNKMGHHADIAFGWGYCQITYTNHEAGGLTANDFICAAKLDELVA